MKFKPLTSLNELHEAKKLLYLSYIENVGWLPTQTNPSGLLVSESNGEKFLTDNLDFRSLWFGIFNDSNVLIACARIIKSQDKKLEFNLYTSLPKDFKHDLSQCVEMNRVAIRPGFENTSALALLVGELIHSCMLQGFSQILTTVSFPNPGNFLVHLGWHRWPNTEFKYAEDEQRAVEIMSLDLKDSLKIEKIRNIFENLMAA